MLSYMTPACHFQECTGPRTKKCPKDFLACFSAPGSERLKKLSEAFGTREPPTPKALLRALGAHQGLQSRPPISTGVPRASGQQVAQRAPGLERPKNFLTVWSARWGRQVCKLQSCCNIEVLTGLYWATFMGESVFCMAYYSLGEHKPPRER